LYLATGRYAPHSIKTLKNNEPRNREAPNTYYKMLLTPALKEEEYTPEDLFEYATMYYGGNLSAPALLAGFEACFDPCIVTALLFSIFL